MVMNAQFTEALHKVAPLILEETAFVFTDDLSDPPPGPEWKPVGAQVKFKGTNIEGGLRVWTDPKFARTVAANMLGVEEDDPQGEQRASDALGELLNIVLGNVLTQAYGDGPVFHLSIPAVRPDALWQTDLKSEGLWLMVEGFPIVFQGDD
jgi:CheY-specific phosphatase CheX